MQEMLLYSNVNHVNVTLTTTMALVWRANMDLQYAYACVMYVAPYIMKTERSMGVLLKRVATETRTADLKSQLRKVGSAFLTQRSLCPGSCV